MANESNTSADLLADQVLQLLSDGSIKTIDESSTFYKVGTWTPAVQGESTAGSYSATTTGNYIKVGNLVFLMFGIIDITEVTAGSGNLLITGLPFAPSELSHVALGRYDNLDLPAGTIGVSAQLRSTSTMRIYAMFDNAAISSIQISAITSGSTDLFLSAMYQTA